MIIHDPSVEEFDKIVASGKVLIDFWATWCGPCRAQAPIAEQLEAATDVTLVKVDVDKCEELSERFGITSIPTLVFYVDGKQINTLIGLTPLDELKKQFSL